MRPLSYLFFLLPFGLAAQDSLSFGGVYDLPGAEVRATYTPVDRLAQRFTIEEVYRLPGTFYDPARLVALLPGVVQSNDQANHLSVRGNSPNKNLWRLNGLAVVNPNHTANAGTFFDFPTLNGGGVNAISAQMLDNSGFFAGGLPIRYGNTTGGTFDLRLRPGSKQGHRQQLQAGFIGIDLAAEGPIGARRQWSYLANARYSFTGLLGDAGVDFGGEEIRFADLNLHLNRRDERSDLSIFAILGTSSNRFFPEEETETQKDLSRINYFDDLAVYGATYERNLARGVLRLGAGGSVNGPERSQLLLPTLDSAFDWVIADLRHHRYNAYTDYELPLNERWSFRVGVEVLRDEVVRRFFAGRAVGQVRNPNVGRVEVTNISPYAAIFLKTNRVEIEYGARNDLYLSPFGATSVAFSPRVRVHLPGRAGGWTFTSEILNQAPIASWLSQDQLPNAPGIEPLHTAALSLSYARRFGGVSTKATGFLQYTPDEPAAPVDGFLYSANNLLEIDPFLEFSDFADTRRLGLELEAAGGRKSEGLYYRGSLTLLDSRTQQGPSSDWRKDRFATDFIAKFTLGREWTATDRKDRDRTLGFNLALIAHGGERYGAIVRRPAAEEEILDYFMQPDYTDGFTNDLGTYFRPDLRLYKTKIRPRTTTTLALDVQNVAGIRNAGNVYYDVFLDRPNEREQLGLIPVLSYRIRWR